MQLSSDYIERYLGKLDLMQESKLVQLRHSIEELRGNSIPQDATLLRFLRASEFSVEKAKEMLTQSLHWRKKHGIDKLLDEYEAPQVVKDYFPGGWHHFDKGNFNYIRDTIEFLTTYYPNDEFTYRWKTFVRSKTRTNGCQRITQIHWRR